MTRILICAFVVTVIFPHEHHEGWLGLIADLGTFAVLASISLGAAAIIRIVRRKQTP
jgi:hypothetical protein